MLGISMCQRAESGISLGTLEAGKLVQRQEVVSRDGEPTPSPMEVFGTQESEGDVLSKMGQSAHEINDHPEVTSPHKPLKLANAFEDNKEQRSDQGIIKAQGGRGRIKNLARELGPTQGKDSETKNLIIGTKCQGSQIFPERDEKVARKKKCDGVTGNSNDELVSATAGSHEFVRMELPGAWEPSVSSSVARSCATMGSQNSFLIEN